jgi:BASS family bile acid:Na+ symporter
MLLEVALPSALIVAMFTLGLGLRFADFAAIASRPKAFFAGAVLQVIVLPSTAFAVALLFALPPELGLGLVILALCPGGPTSNLFTKYAKGDVALSISLTAGITLTSVFTIPPIAGFASAYFLGSGAERIDVAGLAMFMVATTFLPVVAGMLVNETMTGFARRIEPSFSILTVIILAGFVFAALASNWSFFVEHVGGLALSCFVVLVLMLAAGLLTGRLAGLERAQTTSISIDTALQNGAMGIAVATMVSGQQDTVSPMAVPAGVYGLLMYGAIIPFVLWRRQG